MVEGKEIATLFRIERINDELEQLIPFEVVEGTFDVENYTFTTTNGRVLSHIEETEYPNIGFANKIYSDHDPEAPIDDYNNIESVKEVKLKHELEFKYVRFVSEIYKIYKKSPSDPTSVVMEDCDSRRYKERMKKLKSRAESTDIDMSPEEIVQEIQKTIKGQDEAIKTISTCIWATLRDKTLTKKQMLLIGPTGVGKTAIFKKLQKILDIPVIIFSVPGLSQAGYTGRSTDEILKQIYFECYEDRERAENSIVILDELDKIAFNKDITSADVSTVGVQNELLKMVEGYTRVVEIDNGMDEFTLDTSNIIFIATGAFQELFEPKKTSLGFARQEIEFKNDVTSTDSLVKYGLKRELIGRFPIRVKLEQLTKEIFREIILESDESELLAHINFLDDLGVTVTNVDEIIDIIIEDAISKEIGARGLVTTISTLFLDVIYEVANHPNKYKEVIIGKNIINDPKDFILVENRNKKRVKKNEDSV